MIGVALLEKMMGEVRVNSKEMVALRQFIDIGTEDRFSGGRGGGVDATFHLKE